MVIFQAEAFFPDPAFPGGDPRLHRISVPAPVDPETPDVDWWLDHIAKQCAHLRRVGFSAVLLPPVCKTQSGNKPTGSGYGLFSHYDIGSQNQQGSVETRFGNREQLQRCIAIAHANGLSVHGDMVLHQMAGGKSGVYRYKGASTPEHPDGVPDVGRFPKDPGCFRGGVDGKTIPPFRPQDPVPAPLDDFPFGDNCVYANADPPDYMIAGVKKWADWLCQSLDFDGFRIDDTKGLNVDPFLRDFLNQGEMADRWLFNEFFDGSPDTLEWYCKHEMHGRMSMLDFSAHWAIKDVLDYGHGMWRWLPQQTYAGRDPFHSVTFVDSPDTDLSPGQQVINSKLLGYAYILLLLEGSPIIYHRDYSTDPGCYGLQPHIDNMVWCHTHLVGGQTAIRHVDRDVIVAERLGYQVGMPGALVGISVDPWNAREITCATSFGPHAHLKDYDGHSGDIWTDSNGWTTLTIPSNYFGAGNSYVCYAPVGVPDGPRPGPRRTTQTFFGATDLDIPPVYNGPHGVGRIWCAAGTRLGASLRLDPPGLPVDAKLSLVIRAADRVLGEWPSNFDGISSIDDPHDPDRGHFTVLVDGWLSFVLRASGLSPAGIGFALTAVYTGTTGLPHV